MNIQSEEKMPAYPIFVKDPFFSFWLCAQELNGDTVRVWTGQEKTVLGKIECNGKIYRFMGLGEGEKLTQTEIFTTAFTTDFTFSCEEFDLSVSFFSPLDPRNTETIGYPFCYMSYRISPKAKIKSCKVSLIFGADVCSDASLQKTGISAVTGGRVRTGNYTAAWMGLRRQNILSHAGDGVFPDWGYWYAAGKDAEYTETDDCARGGKSYITASDSRLSGVFAVVFDETAAIYYYGDILKGYYYENGKTPFDALSDAFEKYDSLKKEADAFDEALRKEALAYGEDYYLILKASLRQSVAAHKLCRDKEGNILFLSKECFSNGCIATADVSYPSIPLYLKYNPTLVKGMMLPILKFAKMPVWKYDFAPHDAGCYPYCCGQVYGLSNDSGNLVAQRGEFGQKQTFYPIWQLPRMDGIWRDDSQMPVEECSNLLIMAAAYLRYGDGDEQFVRDNFELFEKWGKYLEKYGYCPDNQLCTDDFAGHLDKNVNLSVKASVGLAAFSDLCAAVGERDLAGKYRAKASAHAKNLENALPCPMPLTFDGGEFSLKYNMAFDHKLGYRLYSSRLKEAECDEYIARAFPYGTPLDSRKTYTKSDWILWAASLTQDKEKAKKILAPVAKYIRESPTAVPFSDWYETVDGKQVGFQNRSVQGGCFMLLLSDRNTMI